MKKILSDGNFTQSDEHTDIIKLADKMARDFDRRKNIGEFRLEKEGHLYSIFNTLNFENTKNNKDIQYVYGKDILYENESISFPVSIEKISNSDPLFYDKVKTRLSEKWKYAKESLDSINSFLTVLEQNTSYIPASVTEKTEVSLYDHIKQSIAIGSIIYEYFVEKDYLQKSRQIYENSNDFYEEKSILLYSMDVSGIQDFIYRQYGKKDVLKNLRARSFYLDILLENIIDELLTEVNLSKANILYAGGGHAYLILANTEETKNVLKNFSKDLGDWIEKYFTTDLFVGTGYTLCSPNDLQNKPEGTYQDRFREVSSAISVNKLHRYNAKQIINLNKNRHIDGKRECKICHTSNNVDDKGVCSLCNGFKKLSKDILEKDFFCIINDEKDGILPIYKNGYLSSENINEKEYISVNKSKVIRAYSKNHLFKGEGFVKTIYVGDYHIGNTLEKLLDNSTGIKRLGVLRGDIDNLGKAFVNGFDPKIQTLSKSSVLSKKLSSFFKYDINNILKNGVYELPLEDFNKDKSRKIAIIYSGGDDIFAVGAWKDILGFSIDLYENLKRYTKERLSISVGLGIYKYKYPVSYMAEKTGELEECSKKLDGKNAITLFDKDNSYHWSEFIEEVLGEKFRIIREFFDLTEDRGKSLLYSLLELFRNREEKINIARMAYTLARMEPDKKAGEHIKTAYRMLKAKVYEWMLDKKDSRQAITAIYIYIYLIR